MMNVGLCMPQPGFLKGLRDIATKNGALLIFDEVKTGAKLGWGGACEYFGVKPDMICLAKSIGGGLPLAAFGATKIGDGPDLAAQGLPRRHLQHQPGVDGRGAGDLPRSPYARQLRARRQAEQEARRRLSQDHRESRPASLHRASRSQRRADARIPRKFATIATGPTVDIDLWRQYWFAMVNRGVMAQPYWWDEQWTISVQHTEADIDKHLAAFDDIAASLAKAQQERSESVRGRQSRTRQVISWQPVLCVKRKTDDCRLMTD